MLLGSTWKAHTSPSFNRDCNVNPEGMVGGQTFIFTGNNRIASLCNFLPLYKTKAIKG